MDNKVSGIIKGALGKVRLALSIEDVISYALQELKDITECQSCGIITVDEDGTIRIKNSRGLSGEFIKRLHQAKKMALVDDVISSKKHLLLEKSHPNFNRDGYVFENPCKTLYATPLIFKDKAIGVFFMSSGREGAFPDEAMRGIGELSSLLTLLVYQRLLEEGLSRTVNYDTLTSFYNARHFSHELAREINRAATCKHPLTVMLASIGHMDEYNDIYGHSEGDMAIVVISRLINRYIRAIDIPCRSGGKFSIIFPEMEKSDVEKIAFAICKEMDKNPTGKEPALTLRMGISSYPADASELKGLINTAEKNLLESKRKGGNSFTA